MRLSPRSRDRKCSRSLGAGTGHWGASRNLGSSILSFLYLCCSEVSDLCFPPGRLLSSLSAFSVALCTQWKMAASGGPRGLFTSFSSGLTLCLAQGFRAANKNCLEPPRCPKALGEHLIGPVGSGVHPLANQLRPREGLVPLGPSVGAGEQRLWEGGSGRFLKRRIRWLSYSDVPDRLRAPEPPGTERDS